MTTGNKCLLDTSVIIHFFRNNPSIVKRLSTFTEVYINSTVIGELYYGAFASSDPEKHIKQVRSFLANCLFISIDQHTAETYGKIKADLKKIGKPIPENDIWIAASSIANTLPLFTTDSHFGLVNIQLVPIEG